MIFPLVTNWSSKSKPLTLDYLLIFEVEFWGLHILLFFLSYFISRVYPVGNIIA